ncbi:MAG: hypothetical protein R3E65_07290 [Steroidobacteraceae bacterium]
MPASWPAATARSRRAGPGAAEGQGKREYTSLLYLPSRALFDLHQRDAARGLKLYVRRVFTADDAEQFLPLYLRFVKGVLDSSDLPPNVSRELLQRDPDVDAMKSARSSARSNLIAKFAKDEPEKYPAFWKEHLARSWKEASWPRMPPTARCCRCCAREHARRQRRAEGRACRVRRAA